MNVLVTGGAGYIGSHVVKQLGELTNHTITVIDNLSTGYEKNILYGKFINEDLSNTQKIKEIFKENNFDVVIHFAASIIVSESVENPLKYYMNNTINTINLINIASSHNVKKFIFSSTAAVYGNPNIIPIKEDAKLQPINPYGNSKLMSEKVLIDTAKVNSDFTYVILRYFNVAGASIDGKIGQVSDNATHLIKIASEVAVGKRNKMYIFGDNYNTKDGTCIRDYVHVEDLASAHLSAIEYNGSDIFNCGYGKGFSVEEVINTMKNITKIDFSVKIADKRLGDPSILIADNTKIKSKMKWIPKYDNLKLICENAYQWEKQL